MIPFARMLEYGNVYIKRLKGIVTQIQTYTGFGLWGTRGTSYNNVMYIINDTGRLYKVDAYSHSNSYVATASGGTARNVGITMSNDYVYVAGGLTSKSVELNRFVRYNISSNSWTTLQQMPAAAHNCELGIDVAGGIIYMVSKSLFYKYTISTNSWSAIAQPSSVPTGTGALCFYDSYLYYTNRGVMMRYNPVSNTWTTLTPYSVQLSDFAHMVECFGSLYIAGGSSGVYEYNITLDKWRVINPDSPIGGYENGLGRINDSLYLCNGNTLYKID